MEDDPILIVDPTKAAECGRVLLLRGFRADPDIQPLGKLLELDQEFFVGHGFGNPPLRFCVAIRFGNVLWIIRPRAPLRNRVRGCG